MTLPPPKPNKFRALPRILPRRESSSFPVKFAPNSWRARGKATVASAVGYMLPTLIGNIIGGVSLVAAINHAQVVAD